MKKPVVKDPVCGMTVNKETATKKGLVIGSNYFCSKNCMDKFQNKKSDGSTPWYKSDKFGKIFPWVLGITLITFSILSIIYDFMLTYMGIFFIAFSLMKIPDWKGFIEAFKQYDILAKYIPGYALLYPAIEFILGVLFLTNNYIATASWIVIILLGIGGIGVTIKIMKKEKFQCACLGTFINVPLTKITLLEDIIMVGMAVSLLFF